MKASCRWKDRATPTRLSRMLHIYRTIVLQDAGLRGLAKQIGISASTLCRIEAGYAVDQRSLLKLAAWLTEPTQ